MLAPLQFVPINESSFTSNSINIDKTNDHNKVIPGRYIASSSSYYDSNTMPFQAFNKNTSNSICWQSNTFPNPNQSKPIITNPKKPIPYTQTPYSNNDGSYQGGGRNNSCYFTTSINNVGNKNDVDGEWIQIKLPEPVKLSSYTILTPSQQGDLNFFPEKFTLVGSNDGFNWTYIDFQNVKSQNYSLSDKKPVSFDLNTNELYNYYRLIIIKMPINNTIVRINQFSLFGLPASSDTTKENFIGMFNSPNIEPMDNRWNNRYGGNNYNDSRSYVPRIDPLSLTSGSGVPQPNMNNIYINGWGADAISQASQIANDPYWNKVMAAVEDKSKSYGHVCGPSSDPKKSLDTVAVDALNDLKNKSNDIKNKASGFLNTYNDPNGNVGRELQRILNILNQPTLYSNLNSVNTMINDENNRLTKLNESQIQIRAEYSAKKAVITQRKTELDGKISTSTSIKVDKEGKLNSLLQLKPTVDTNVQQLQPTNNVLASSAALNQQRLNYLNDRVNTTRSVALDNYENLYKAIILQNQMLEKNESEVKTGLVTTQRKTEFISSSKSFIYNIYTKLMLFYYILVIIFAGFLVFSQKTWSFYAKIAIFMLSVIYPYIIIFIETWGYNLWLYILSIISGSVYTHRSLL
jgi:hypothetical protein